MRGTEKIRERTEHTDCHAECDAWLITCTELIRLLKDGYNNC